MRDEFCPVRVLILALMCCLTLGSLCPAVNSKVVRHTSSSALLKGKTENVVIGSRGTIQLGRAAEAMVGKSEDFAGVWSINSIIADGETIYFGTTEGYVLGVDPYTMEKVSRVRTKGSVPMMLKIEGTMAYTAREGSLRGLRFPDSPIR